MIDYKTFNKYFRIMDQAVFVELRKIERHPLQLGVGPDKGGVYALFHNDVLKYVGSAKSSLRKRLKDHVQRVEGRIPLEEMKVSYIIFDYEQARHFELSLMRDYNKPEWNNSGFGNADPERSKGISKWHKKYPLLNVPAEPPRLILEEDEKVVEAAQ